MDVSIMHSSLIYCINCQPNVGFFFPFFSQISSFCIMQSLKVLFLVTLGLSSGTKNWYILISLLRDLMLFFSDQFRLLLSVQCQIFLYNANHVNIILETCLQNWPIIIISSSGRPPVCAYHWQVLKRTLPVPRRRLGFMTGLLPCLVFIFLNNGL